MSENRGILLVDDSEADVELMRIALRRAEFRSPLHVVGNGEEATAYLLGEGVYGDRDLFPLPAMMLLDLNMPMMSGFDLLAWLGTRQRFKHLMVTILTASMRPEDVELAYDLGAKAFLVKPASLDDLTSMMRCLRDWVSYNRIPPLE